MTGVGIGLIHYAPRVMLFARLTRPLVGRGANLIDLELLAVLDVVLLTVSDRCLPAPAGCPLGSDEAWDEVNEVNEEDEAVRAGEGRRFSSAFSRFLRSFSAAAMACLAVGRWLYDG